MGDANENAVLGEKLVEFYQRHESVEYKDFRFVALKELLISNFKGTSFIDIGCGTGAMTEELILRGLTGLGVEPDPELFALAEKRRGNSLSRFRIMNLTIERLTSELMRDHDNVLLLDVLEHLEDDAGALQKIHSVMKRGSQLLCLVPAISALYGKRDQSVGHFRRYDLGAVRQLFATSAFHSVETRWWNLLGMPVYWWFEKVLKRPVSENFRYSKSGWMSHATNSALTSWFRLVENPVRFPIGLSLLVKAIK